MKKDTSIDIEKTLDIIKDHPVLTIKWYKRVAIAAVITTSSLVLFFLKNPPRNPAMPHPTTWNGVHGPTPPKVIKLDKYPDEAPTRRPFFFPNKNPASIARNVIGSTLGAACIGTLNNAPPKIKPEIISHSFNFKI